MFTPGDVIAAFLVGVVIGALGLLGIAWIGTLVAERRS
jgi:hypothetical protein